MKIEINKIEERILNFWESNKVFEKSLEKRKNSKRFVFFEGPPTANARPGIHHFFGRIIKDLFARYKTMRGFLVIRKAGWDTHGLPVEIEVEKELGLKNKKEIEKYGISKFNSKAKESVWKYKEIWERFTRRIGFWLDLSKPYATYDKNYMESLWHIIGQINKDGFLYQGHKVLPWCPRCGTALSSHEVAQGYRAVTDKSVTVKFIISNFKFPNKLKIQNSKSKIFMLAWTTTPWTLPGNVALAVGSDIEYALIKAGGEYYIVAKDMAEKVMDIKYQIMETILGKELVGLEYEPIFDIEKLKTEKSYRVYSADFVTTQEGTGIVHTAVMYGEDDYNLGTREGLPTHHTVDENGRFTGVGANLDGKYVKDPETEDLIIKELERKDLLFKKDNFEHDYPFCWRCRTPLIYYAKDSWFVAMSRLRKELLSNNKKINWVPGHLKEGRFGEFLREVKDWAFSRERYWGTPLPVWRCRGNGRNKKTEKCENYLVASSFKDLEKYRYKPKNKIFILRHGYSEKNGHAGNPAIISSRLEADKYHLTEDGKEAVKKVAEKLKKAGGADIIISSPFLRTKETAQIIADELGLKVEIDERLKEMDHGIICEGKERHVCGIVNERGRKWNERYGNGESWEDLLKRVSGFLLELDSKHENKKIIIVSHGDPIWFMEAFALGLARDEIPSTREKLYPSQGSVKEINLKNWPYNEKGELDLHRPYVDKILLKCPKCGGKMERVKDVVDVWFDSGAMPFAQWHYPFENKKEFKDNFPADFISEGIDQTRGWFYVLLAVSTLLKKGAPYKNVISYSHVLDEKGKKMSKTLGNAVDPWDIMEKFGADAARWYFYTVNNPGDYKLFSEKDVGVKLFGFMATLLNSLRFFELYYRPGMKLKKVFKPGNALDEWIFSRLNGLITSITSKMDDYDLTGTAAEIENFVMNDFSNWWIRRSRGRFQKPSDREELSDSLSVLYNLLTEISKMISPLIPFVAEEIYFNLHKGRKRPILSVHLSDWPESDKKKINKELEKEMKQVRDLAASALAQRKDANIKVRQPLGEAVLKGKISDERLLDYLTDEINVKKISYDKNQKEDIAINATLTHDLVMEGYARELTRKIQGMRKEAGYGFSQQVGARWSSENNEIKKAVSKFEADIKKDTLLFSLEAGDRPEQAFDVELEFELAPDRKIWVGVFKA